MIRVTFVFSHPVADRLWDRAATTLAAEGIALRVVSQSAPLDWAVFAAEAVAPAAACWIECGRVSPGFAAVIEAVRDVPLVVAAGLEARAVLGDDRAAVRSEIEAYLRAGSGDDLINAVRALLHRAGHGAAPPPPGPVWLLGFYHPDLPDALAPEAGFAWAAAHTRPGRCPGPPSFSETSGGLGAPPPSGSGRQPGEAPAVVLLFDRGGWLNRDLAAIDALIAAAENVGLLPLALFCASELTRDWGPLTRVLDALDGRLVAIWNAAGLHGAAIEAEPFSRHGVPVIQLLRDWSRDEAGWRADPAGLSAVSLLFGLIRPEMMGTVDPVLVTVTEREDEARRARPVADQIARLAGRTRALATLRQKPNAEKRVAILLHTPPCKGLEASIGTAPGLDALESTARLLHRLAAEGYEVGTPPADGAELLALIRDRRAVQEFRWTSVGEIVAAGGALDLIDAETYRADFDRLPVEVREQIDAAWGAFPGEAMVHPDALGAPALVISGLCFGRVLVLTEPKRGCHRARCDGEVCRILHDPLIPPPHHWLATFWFLRRRVDAVVTMGAESPIEYLPGKRTALSERCYPTVTLGDLPVIQAALVSAQGEIAMARRRGRAVTIGHLGAPLARADALGTGWDEIEDLLARHRQAEGARRAELERSAVARLEGLGLLPPDLDETARATAFEALPRRLRRLRARQLELAPHVLGQVPDPATTARYLDEARGPVGRAIDAAVLRDRLASTGTELDAVVAALAGRFVSPGPGGHLSRGRVECLPTGRNPFAVDLRRLPTPEAEAVGARMGARLLAAWRAEGGEDFPRSVGLTLWSSDAFQAEGETLAQALWLLGCHPLRDADGRVSGVAVTPLDQLTLIGPDGSARARPRCDVMVQISGVVRDTLPGLCGLIDQAVALVAALDEPAERNFVRAHVEERLAALDAAAALAPDLRRRLALARVFGPPEGGQGGGLGLALDASAWDSDADLAEIVINHGGHAYQGDGRALAGGVAALGEYAEALRRTELWCQRQTGPAGDLLSTGCAVQGGGAAAAARRGLGGAAMRLFWSDSQSGPDGEVRGLAEELADSLALTLLNPDWLALARTRGYAGARDLSDRVNRLFGWAAAARVVRSDQFDAVCDRLLGDGAVRDWVTAANPAAFDEITRRLSEAAARGLWRPDPARAAVLEASILALEGDEEERRGPAAGESQGGAVTIRARASVPGWEVAYRVE